MKKVKCPICSKEFKQITNSHLKQHNLTIDEFKNIYPASSLVSDILKSELKKRSLKADNSEYINKLKNENIKKYNINPSFCKHCSKQLSYEQRKNKFCNSSCSASSNNKKREQRSDESLKKTSESIKHQNIVKYNKNPNRCKLCNSIIKYEKRTQKYCSIHYRNKVLRKPKTNKIKFEIVGVYTKLYRCTCKHCNTKMLLPSPKQYCDTCKVYHSNLRMRYVFSFNVYHYPDLFDLELLNQKGWYAPRGKSGKWNPDGLSRDHKVSISEAIKNNYDPYYITHPLNCELMPHIENQKKHYRSSISYSLLKQMVDEYDNQP